MGRGIVIICCYGFKTITKVVDTNEPIMLSEAEIKAEFDRMDDPIQWQYPEIEKKHDRRAEKALFSFHGNKYRNMSNYSKNIRKNINRKLIRNRNNI